MLKCIFSGLPLYWKPDFETRLTRPGFKFNFAAMSVTNDAIADEQSEARAGADRFGGEKRLKHSGLDLTRNTGAIVHDLYDNLVMFKRSANANPPFPIYGGDGVI